MELKIKEEFKKLIPPLTAEEFKQLETNCINEGIRDAIVTWNGFIIDGHNRYKIATDWQLSFKTIEKTFDSEEAVKEWMIINQFGRRNLSNYDRAKLGLELEDIFSKKAKANLKLSGEIYGKGCQISDKPITLFKEQPIEKKSIIINTIDTKKEVAKIANVSHDTIAKVKVIEQKAAPEVKEKLSTGEISINQAYQDIKKEEKKEEFNVKRKMISEQVNHVDINDIPEKFDVIYCDPPWRYDFSETTNREIENHYTTMDCKDICKMNVPAADNCVLFMWATAPKLLEAIEVIKAWGFEYKTHAIWDKEKIGMGYWFRGQHELLMVATKGKVSPPDSAIRISSVIKEERTKHSRKPDCVAEYIELAFFEKSKIELFCREPRKGWYSFGNQI
jgi:N6-adenosine-specific RNA methylase IME4